MLPLSQHLSQVASTTYCIFCVLVAAWQTTPCAFIWPFYPSFLFICGNTGQTRRQFKNQAGENENQLEKIQFNGTRMSMKARTNQLFWQIFNKVLAWTKSLVEHKACVSIDVNCDKVIIHQICLTDCIMSTNTYESLFLENHYSHFVLEFRVVQVNHLFMKFDFWPGRGLYSIKRFENIIQI